MKYALGLGVTALLIITLAVVWLFSDSKLQKAQDQMEESAKQLAVQTDNDSTQVEMNGFGTINDLLGRDESLECQITTITNSIADEGTFFVADQKIRADFITDTPDLQDTTVSSMIVRDATLYVWTEINGESYGVKASLQTVAETDVPTQEPVGLDERVKYSCQKWEQVDQSVFIPPSDILFSDVSEVLQGEMEYGTVYEEGEEMPN